MRSRTKRLYAISLAAALLLAASLLAFLALRRHADLFYTPQLLVERGLPDLGNRVRLGGFVGVNSLAHGDGAEILFTIEDGSGETVRVRYIGITPDLFREGQGVVATGQFKTDYDVFEAETLLAKHDENYQPRELRDLEMQSAS